MWQCCTVIHYLFTLEIRWSWKMYVQNKIHIQQIYQIPELVSILLHFPLEVSTDLLFSVHFTQLHSHTHTHIHTHAHTRTHTHTHTHTHTQKTYTHTSPCTHTRMHVHTHTHTYTYKHTPYTHTHTPHTYTCEHTYTHPNPNIQPLPHPKHTTIAPAHTHNHHNPQQTLTLERSLPDAHSLPDQLPVTPRGAAATPRLLLLPTTAGVGRARQAWRHGRHATHHAQTGRLSQRKHRIVLDFYRGQDVWVGMYM